MEAQRIQGENVVVLGPPQDWDKAKYGPCDHLQVRTFEDNSLAGGYCESAWKPSAAELQALNEGANVILRVYSAQVPVALYVEKENAHEKH